MADPEALRATLSPACDVNIPKDGAVLHDYVSRWSDTEVNLPFAVVKPSSTSDIINVIQFAREHGLKMIPTNGGHASFVPITSKTIYLDMSYFKGITLDQEKEEVKIGGGVVSGDVLKALTPQGWYTLTPNSNAVGVIGALLGGLSHSMNGYHGFGIDHVNAISIIPFSNPKEITLTPGSTGEDKKLFNILCGAGHGFGIITSITLRAFRISNLSLTDGSKIWARRLIFPASQIATAAKLYTSLLPPHPKLTVVLAFMRAPPTAPNAGSPMVMLGLSFFGPAAEAEEACRLTFEEDYVGKAMMNVTVPTEWEAQNMGFEAINRHGDYKEYHGCFVKETKAESIVSAFEEWESYTGQDVKGRGTSYVVIGGWNTDQLVKNAGERDEKFFPGRDHGVFVQATPWYSKAEDKERSDGFGRTVVEAMRETDAKAGRRKWCFSNNMIAGQDMTEVYRKEQLEEIRRVKNYWDEGGVGWSPVVDEW